MESTSKIAIEFLKRTDYEIKLTITGMYKVNSGKNDK